MAKPDWTVTGKINTSNDWRALNLDVGRAIAATNWPGHSLMLVFYVIENSWAAYTSDGKRPDAQPVAINCYTLSDRWGVHRQRLSEAKNFLLKNNIIKGTEAFTFNKHAHEWGTGFGTDGFKPLISEKLGKYAGEAKSKRQPKTKAADTPVEPTTNLDASCTDSRTLYAQNPGQHMHGSADTTCTEVRTVEGVSHIQGAPARNLDLMYIQEEGESPPEAFQTPDRYLPRPQKDQDQFNEAVDILMSDMLTEGIGSNLLRNQNTTDIKALCGWQFLVAAKILTGPAVEHRNKSKIAYFMGIARNADITELAPKAKPTRERFLEPPAPQLRKAADIIAEREAEFAKLDCVPCPEHIREKIRRHTGGAA